MDARVRRLRRREPVHDDSILAGTAFEGAMNSAGTQGKAPLRVVAFLAGAMACAWSAQPSAEEPSVAPRSGQPLPARWAATAPGWVEPRSQETRIATPIAGRIADVLVKANDTVFAGELMVRLDDDEAQARLAAADAQVALHERARDGERRRGPTTRRRAEDDAADTERDVARARFALDKIS